MVALDFAFDTLPKSVKIRRQNSYKNLAWVLLDYLQQQCLHFQSFCLMFFFFLSRPESFSSSTHLVVHKNTVGILKIEWHLQNLLNGLAYLAVASVYLLVFLLIYIPWSQCYNWKHHALHATHMPLWQSSPVLLAP